jgi:hypothetical protein
MPAIACKNCGALIEYWPASRPVAVSCTSCKRVTIAQALKMRSAPVAGKPQTGRAVRADPIRSKPRWPRHRIRTGVRNIAGEFGRGAATVLRVVVAGGLALAVSAAISAAVPAIRSLVSKKQQDRGSGTPTHEPARTERTADPLERALSIPGNEKFADWLAEPVSMLEPPPPRRVRLPHARWEDDSNTITVIDGVRYRSDRDPLRFRIQESIDEALAVAIDRQFGQPADYFGPQSWYYDDDGSKPILAAARRRHCAELCEAHGLRGSELVVGPDYDWIVERSTEACRPIATAIVLAVTGRHPTQVSPRERVEALTSYVQNAIPYVRDFEEERSRMHGDAAERFELMTPLMTLLRGGDCDSKSLLLAALIRSVDATVPLALVHCMLSDEPHVCLAVGVPHGPGERTFQHGSRAFTLIEATDDWDIGRLSPDTDLSRPEWRPLR